MIVEEFCYTLVHEADWKVEQEKDSEDGCHKYQQHPLKIFGTTYLFDDYFGHFFLRHQLNLYPYESDYELILCHGRELMTYNCQSHQYRICFLWVKQPIYGAYWDAGNDYQNIDNMWHPTKLLHVSREPVKPYAATNLKYSK